MNNIPIGVIVRLDNILENGINDIEEAGLKTCQLNCWDPNMFTSKNADRVKEIMENKVSIASLWVGWPGPAVWNFIDGPLTLGLVPKEYRFVRMECLKRGADFAHMLGICDITTHMGFIPENPSTSEYRELVIAVKEVGSYCRRLGLHFNFETGQETPVTLMRTIADTDLDNLGVNFDPANLLMYGKANPIDALDIYKGCVRGVHVKDGMYPTNYRELGMETPVGEGLVNFRCLIPKLVGYGFDGALIIEREISGPKQKGDIIKAKKLLESIFETL